MRRSNRTTYAVLECDTMRTLSEGFQKRKALPQHHNSLAAHFLLRWRATSDFLKPSKLKRRLAKRLAAATSARLLPLVRVSLLPRPSLSLRSWSSSESVARRAFSLLRGGWEGGVRGRREGRNKEVMWKGRERWKLQRSVNN